MDQTASRGCQADKMLFSMDKFLATHERGVTMRELSSVALQLLFDFS